MDSLVTKSSSPAKRWSLKKRQLRLILYLVVLLGFAAWRLLPRPWHPSLTIETDRHKIFSTATREQTDAVANTLHLLYAAYSNRLGMLAGFPTNPAKMQVHLYKDRAELRQVNPGLGWAEAFYSPPACRAYYSAAEINPFHWMLHESVHQLNHEIAHLRLEKWLEEGLAEYFSTSQLHVTGLAPGQIDLNTYPVWWIDELATRTNLLENLANGSVIPLRAIITNRGGPSMNRHFNLYYLHWWTLTHFIFEDEAHRPHVLELLQRGGNLETFEALIGPTARVQVEWHEYVLRLKAKLTGRSVKTIRNQSPRSPEDPRSVIEKEFAPQ